MHDRLSLHTVCFSGAPLRGLAESWRELGFPRVTLSGDQIDREGLPVVQQALETGGCGVESITHLFLAGRHFEAGTKSWSEPRERLSRLIADAKTLGARSIYMLTGGHGTLTWEEATDRFAEAVAPCVAEAKAAGVALSIETAGAFRAHFHLAHNLRDTTTLAEKADIGVCLDLFSVWTEAGLQQSIERAMPRVVLVQVGDYVFGDPCLPGRAVPGDGNIPLERILGWVLQAGYRGAFDLELVGARIEKEGGVSAARRAAVHVSEILRRLGA